MEAPKIENVPVGMRNIPNWLCWREEPDRETGKIKKIPVNARGFAYDPDSRKTLTAIDEARQAAEKLHCGIGFQFSNSPFVGFDLDGCFTNNELSPEAASIVEELDSYTEYSPSKQGLHIIVKADRLSVLRNKIKGIPGMKELEIYQEKRYFTVTGKVYGDLRPIAERTDKAQGIIDEYTALLPSSTGGIEDYNDELCDEPAEAVIERIRKSKDGEKFSRLFDDGDTSLNGNDRSATDQSLCNILARHTDGGGGTIREIWSRSALAQRDKFREREDYRKMTIGKAIAGYREYKKLQVAEDFRQAPTAVSYYVERLKKLHPESNPKYPPGDRGQSKLLADALKGKFLFVPERKEWLRYDGTRWAHDVEDVAANHVKYIADALLLYHAGLDGSQRDKGQLTAWFKWSSKSNRDRYLTDAQSEFPISAERFDKNIYLFNCENGTIDLKTGLLREHDPMDYITKKAPVKYDENVAFPRWGSFLNEITEGDSERAEYIQRVFGYCMTGDTSEDCFFIFYGARTRNGKTTLTDTVTGVFGDYSTASGYEIISTLRKHDGQKATGEIARLKGRRMTLISEPEKSLHLNAALLKTLTGGNTITAREMYEKQFDFKPQVKLIIDTNHKPGISDMTLFKSGRVRLIPFNRYFEEHERDTTLKKRFATEEAKSAILNWLLAGLASYKKDRLNPPQSVIAATELYSEESDRIGMFIKEHMESGEGYAVNRADVYRAYADWCAENNFQPESTKTFSNSLTERGIEVKFKRINGGKTGVNAVIGYRLLNGFE
jgi:putative DNA primase/helicase